MWWRAAPAVCRLRSRQSCRAAVEQQGVHRAHRGRCGPTARLVLITRSPRGLPQPAAGRDARFCCWCSRSSPISGGHWSSCAAAASLRSCVVLTDRVRFGPVLSEQAGWLEQTGRLEAAEGAAQKIAVIRADKPA